MYCVSLVTKDHVKEAYRLLNKSIIRVEEPDIDLEDAEQANISVEQDETNGVPSSEDTDKQTASDATSDSAVQKKKISITYESYKAISNLLIMYLRRQEALDESKLNFFSFMNSRLTYFMKRCFIFNSRKFT